MKQYILATLLLGGSASSLTGCSGNVGTGNNSGDGSDTDSSNDGAGGGPSGPPPVSACSGEASVGVGRWRRLTKAQYANSVRDLIGEAPDTSAFVADSRTGAFKTNSLLPLQDSDVDTYATLAESLSKKAAGNLTKIVNCNASTTSEDKCAAQFIKDFGARAYRRPLTSAEEMDFTAVYAAGKAESHAAGLQLIIEAALQSPQFLYMVEKGAGAGGALKRLTGHEVATRLSYLFTGTMPDAALFASARAGDLDTPLGVEAAAKRLMASPKFNEQAGTFANELLGTDKLFEGNAIAKPTSQFPQFDAAMREAMAQEPAKFADYVLSKGDGTIEELLTAQYVFPTGPLAKAYGGLKADAQGRAQVTDGSRSGFLTLASTQAVHPLIATPKGAVNRGHLVRREFLCETVPPPLVNVDFKLPPNAAELSAQELLREHQKNETCVGCHRLMDSIGFAFESYDLMGSHRTKDERGKAIDTSGEIVGLDSSGTFKNAREMTQLLAKSPQVRACLSTQWFRYALGRDPDESDACTEQLVTKVLSKGKGNIKDALLALVVSDSFRFKGEQ